jgi:L-asparaginase
MITIITTGGTIDKIYFDAQSEFHIGEPQVGEVLREAGVTAVYKVIPLLRKDSLELTDEDRQLIYDTIAQAPGHLFVVTHGTDTMTTTAEQLMRIPDKTIVLTGAMQPARFRQTDAVFNIASAITAVQTLPPGVFITMNGRVFQAGNVRKNLAKRCFELNSDA